MSSALLKPYGLSPTGPEGTYRRRDYLRGAAIAVGIGLLAAAILVLSALALDAKSTTVLVLSFVLGIASAMAAASAIRFLVCAAFGVARPPLFADPYARTVTHDDEDWGDDAA